MAREDIVLKRDENGKPTANVEHKWKAHSPNGFEFGYGGSGPADLALNILIKFGLSRERAWDLHQDFKWRFVARIPKDAGGVISANDIDAWIAERSKEYSGPDIA
jgi:hypothetical protein